MKFVIQEVFFFSSKKNPCLFSFVEGHMVEKNTRVVASLCDQEVCYCPSVNLSFSFVLFLLCWVAFTFRSRC